MIDGSTCNSHINVRSTSSFGPLFFFFFFGLFLSVFFPAAAAFPAGGLAWRLAGFFFRAERADASHQQAEGRERAASEFQEIKKFQLNNLYFEKKGSR